MILLDPRRMNSEITMTRLVEETGLAERQIRRCIAEGLVDKAEGKGRAARYSEATLRTLKVISKLMTQTVKPLNRQLTLTEIKSTLRTLTTEQEEEILAGMPFSFIDTEAGASEPAEPPALDSRLKSEFLDIHEAAAEDESLGDADVPINRMVSREAFHQTSSRLLNNQIHHRYQRRRGTTFYHSELGELGLLLEMLEQKLASLTDRQEPLDPAPGNTWARVRTRSSMLEIHVKSPEDESERARLLALLRPLRKLIRLVHEPYNDGYDPYDD